jgi:hypothetical protein
MCARDIDRTSLVRCRETRCPLKQEQDASPLRRATGVGVMGLLIALPLLGLAVLLLAHHRSASTSTSTDSASSEVVSTNSATSDFATGSSQSTEQASGKRVSWLGGLFGGHDDAPVDNAPPQVADDAPDPQAGTRVQTFSCAGALSASRATICTHWELATADYNLSLLYNNMLAHSPRGAELRRDHSAFLKALDRLNDNPERILALYRDWQTRFAAAVSRT